jgi:segregation and condensation protein B
MSLKAKLEAVIYAAEEPVTLTQLATLFSAEALEWKAAQEAAAKAATEASSEPAEKQSVIPEELEYLGLEDSPSFRAEVQAEAKADVSTGELTAPEDGAEESADSPVEDEASQTETADSVVDPEAEAKRLARLRDREIKAVLREILQEVIADYAADNRGIEIREIAGGYRMATKPQCHDAVRLFIKSLKPALKLSLPALETLAVIAYKQPVTAPEVNEIRGVDSSGVFGSLLSRKLITTAGRKQVIGRPILYKTTKEFLLRFGLKDVSELPSMEEFEKIAAIELSEPGNEDAENGEDVGGPGPGGGPELDENASEDGEDAVAPAAAPTAVSEESSTASDETAQATEVERREAAAETSTTEEKEKTETPEHG